MPDYVVYVSQQPDWGKGITAIIRHSSVVQASTLCPALFNLASPIKPSPFPSPGHPTRGKWEISLQVDNMIAQESRRKYKRRIYACPIYVWPGERIVFFEFHELPLLSAPYLLCAVLPLFFRQMEFIGLRQHRAHNLNYSRRFSGRGQT